MAYTSTIYVPPQNWANASFDLYGIGTIQDSYWTDSTYTKIKVIGSNGIIYYIFDRNIYDFGYTYITSFEIRNTSDQLLAKDTGLSLYWDGTDAGIDTAMAEYERTDLNLILTDQDDIYDLDPAENGLYSSEGETLTIDGRGGNDTIYSSNWSTSDFTITKKANGNYEVTINSTGQKTELINIEYVDLADTNLLTLDQAYTLYGLDNYYSSKSSSDASIPSINTHTSSTGATISSIYALDMTDLDLNRLYSGAWQSGLLDNSNFYFNGKQYEDSYVVDWYAGGVYYGSVFGGSGMTVNAQQEITGGTATGYLETYWDGSAYVPYFAIENISINAIDIWNAALTTSLTDDDALLVSMLSGDDTINGSSYGDTLLGLNGNDKFYAGDGDDTIFADAGNDIIYGGNGTDTYSAASLSRSDLFVSKISGGFKLESTQFGTDLLYGVEKVLLSDGLHDLADQMPVAIPSSSLLEILSGSKNAEIFNIGLGAKFIDCKENDDVVYLSTTKFYPMFTSAINMSSSSQTGTEQIVTLANKLNYESVIDGGEGIDTVYLSEGNDAFFLHDAISDFHESISLSKDSLNMDSHARFDGLEFLFGGLGNDLIDLTSPDYSLSGQSLTLNGGEGDDILWGSDADESLIGDLGNDILFGGIGTNTLTGGSGADIFQFTKTSTQDTVTDFNVAEGDTIAFFNKGGAIFDRSSLDLTNGVLTINYDSTNTISIDLSNTSLLLSDIESNILII